MPNELLNDVLQCLYKVKEGLHDDVGNSVIQELDKAIEFLEEASNESHQIKASECLEVLGKILMKVPAIIHLLDHFKE